MKHKIIIAFILIMIVFLTLESKSFFMEEIDFKMEVQKSEESYYSNYAFDNETEADSLTEANLKDFIVEPFVLNNMKSFRYGIEDMDLKGGLLRNNNGFIYSIYKVGEGYFIVTYSKGVVVDSWYVEKIPNKVVMTMFLHKGMSADSLQKFDSSISAQIRNGNLITTHRFNDGTMLVIQYNNDGDNVVVEDYNYYRDDVELLKHLLPMDKKLIE